jgi:hypothetical protein
MVVGGRVGGEYPTARLGNQVIVIVLRSKTRLWPRRMVRVRVYRPVGTASPLA